MPRGLRPASHGRGTPACRPAGARRGECPPSLRVVMFDSPPVTNGRDDRHSSGRGAAVYRSARHGTPMPPKRLHGHAAPGDLLLFAPAGAASAGDFICNTCRVSLHSTLSPLTRTRGGRGTIVATNAGRSAERGPFVRRPSVLRLAGASPLRASSVNESNSTCSSSRLGDGSPRGRRGAATAVAALKVPGRGELPSGSYGPTLCTRARRGYSPRPNSFLIGTQGTPGTPRA